MKILAIGFALIAAVTQLCDALECYTCVHQDSNKDKCIKTVKQCLKNQDVCRTNISWGIPPYWTPHGERIYKISKDCDTKKKCQQDMRSLRDQNYVNSQGRLTSRPIMCKRDWYDDWDCVECCSGDMCNFYVTLAASSVQANLMLLLASVSAVLWCYRGH